MRLSTLPLMLVLGACATNQNMTLDPAKAPVVAESGAAVEGCPDWKDEQLPPSAGATSRNFGCAVRSNLAAMVAYPEDLLHGRDNNTAGVDARTSVKAIKIWREATPSGDASLKEVIVREAPTGGGGGK